MTPAEVAASMVCLREVASSTRKSGGGGSSEVEVVSMAVRVEQRLSRTQARLRTMDLRDVSIGSSVQSGFIRNPLRFQRGFNRVSKGISTGSLKCIGDVQARLRTMDVRQAALRVVRQLEALPEVPVPMTFLRTRLKPCRTLTFSLWN